MNEFISGLTRLIGSIFGILFVTMPSIWLWWIVAKSGMEWLKPHVTDGSLFFFVVAGLMWILFISLVFILLNLVFWKYYMKYGTMLANKIDKVFVDG